MTPLTNELRWRASCFSIRSYHFRRELKYGYSNIGYWLLGSIVERASGQSFPSYVGEHVLRPLRIAPQELGSVIPDYRDHAKGYVEKYSWMNLVKRLVIGSELIGGEEGRWVHLNDHYVNGAAFGGLVGNARGFGKFLQDQVRPQSALLGDAARQLFYAPQRSRDGKSLPMTLGWHIGIAGGARFFHMEGGGGGFHSMMRVYPSFGTATVVMTNTTGFDVSKLLDALDSRFLRRSATYPMPRREDPAERTGYLRYFYREWRPTLLGRSWSRAWAWLCGLGLAPRTLVTLQVMNRNSARLEATVLVVATYEGQRYLVSMLGDGSEWVQNVRAAGGKALIKRGRSHPVLLTEIPHRERAPILKAWCQVATSGSKHLPISHRAPTSAFEAIARDYPAFRIDPVLVHE